MICEKCWNDAYGLAAMRGEPQVDCYFELRDSRDHECTPEEQAGEWWDEKLQRDSRLSREHTGE